MNDEYDELRTALEFNPGQKGYDDIARVLAKHDGVNDEEDWAWLVEFKDESRGLYMGACDYTGWDCQSSLTLLPFEDWQATVHKEWPTWGAHAHADTIVAELTEQLDKLR